MTTLEVRDLTVRFGGVTALDGVSFSLEPGQIHGVVGPNGSGKSTMFNAVSGFVRPTAGTVHVDGRDLSHSAPERRIRRGLVRTFQTPRFDHDLSVEETIKSGQRTSVRGGLLASMIPTLRVLRDERAVAARTSDIISRFELDSVRGLALGELPMGMVRLVEVARAVAMNPRYLLLDEPAAGLSREEQAVLVAQLKALAADGMGVLIVEHNFGLLRGLVSDLLVLQEGREIARGAPSGVAENPLVRSAYLGVATDGRTDSSRPLAGDRATSSVPNFEVRDLQVAYGRIQVCQSIDLQVAPGEVVAIVGPNGAGKSSLLNALAGLSDSGRRSSGNVNLEAREINTLDAAVRARSGLAHVPEGRGNIFPTLTVRENLVLAGRVAANDRRRPALERALEVFPRLLDLLSRTAGSMSGGEQQMLAIGMALAQDPAVVMLDEPTQGLAPAVRLTIAEAFGRLRDTGGGPSVLVAEQNYAFATRLADRILVMRAGSLGDLDPEVAAGGAAAVASIYLGADESPEQPADRW